MKISCLFPLHLDLLIPEVICSRVDVVFFVFIVSLNVVFFVSSVSVDVLVLLIFFSESGRFVLDLSSMGDVSVVNWDLAENQTKFVKILKDYPIILEKSMIPQFKKKRATAILEIRSQVEAEFKVEMTESQLWKKIQNMKARMKKKADVNRTGNKKIVLKPWEEDFLEFLEGESNPSIVRIKGAVTAGVANTPPDVNSESEKGDSSEDEQPGEKLDIGKAHFKKLKVDKSSTSPVSMQPKNKKRANLPETEETKRLSTPELQRLVLLEQLNYFRKSQQLVDLKLQRELRRDDRVAEPGISKENNILLMSMFPGEENAQ